MAMKEKETELQEILLNQYETQKSCKQLQDTASMNAISRWLRM